MVETSLHKYGAGRSILVDKHGQIIAGNKTAEAAGAIDLDGLVVVQSDGTRLVVVQRTDLDLDTDPAARELALADNRAGELGLEWDAGILAELGTEIDLSGLWSRDELAELMAAEREPGAGGDDFDTTPDDGPTRVQPGELWQLGQHRLLCGDSTKAEDVARLMQGERADMVFTDPPYGIGYHDIKRRFDAIENDASDPTELIRDAYALLGLNDGTPVYMCCDWRSLQYMRDVLQQLGLTEKAVIVWDKKRGVQNLDRYFKQHEFILYSGPYGGQRTLRGDVWRVLREPNLGDHPTPKPLELVQMALEDSSQRNTLVVDSFLGSGTTLIACERTGRRCYGLEIEPRYCDVILRRWEAETGQTAERVT